MSQVDVYVLPVQQNTDARALFLCKLCTAVRNKGQSIYIHCQNEFEGKRLSRLLWEHKTEAFLANQIYLENPSAPICLGWDSVPKSSHSVFINMGLEIPKSALDYQRILEIVAPDEQIRNAVRENYKLYKAKNITAKVNDMRKR